MAASVSICPAFEVSLTRQAETFTRSFSDYVAGPARLDCEGLARYFYGQAVDLWLSRLLLVGDEVVAFGYINRTGEVSRLAGMGVVPEARRQGFARRLLAQLLEEARDRQDRMMTLEVFEQNPSAVALYHEFEFQEITRLIGWDRDSQAPDRNHQAAECPIENVALRPTRFEYPAIPWQVSRHAAARLAPQSRAFAFGRSLAAVTSPAADPAIRMLHQLPEGSEPDWAELRSLVESLLTLIPKRRWTVLPIIPEEMGEKVFAQLGFSRQRLNQFQMALNLKAPFL